MSTSLRAMCVVLGVAAAGCQCGPSPDEPDAAVERDAGRPPTDAGTVIVYSPDSGPKYPEVYAGEACPPEAFGQVPEAGPDGGGIRFGLCVALRTLTAEALLNGRAVTDSVNLQFVGGGFRSEIDRHPDPFGRLDAKVMRSRYDILKYHPGGVFPTHEGHEDFGFLDMTKDQHRSLSVNSHLLRGGVLFGGLPFIPNRFPQDVYLGAFGLPQGQDVSVTSQAGAYEVSLLEGTFALFLSTPAVSLYGTELRSYQLNTTNIVFDRDQEYDIDIPTSLLEGELTIDGMPMPDRRVGADFALEFVKPGDREAAVVTHHEGGLPSFSALVPKGNYGIQLTFEATPDRHLPSEIYNKPLTPYLNLNQDGHLSANLVTHRIEGGILIDGNPVRPNPAYNWRLFMFGAASATDVSSYLLYEVPLESSSFLLRTFPGNYFTVLWLDDGLGEDLAEGFYVVNRYLQVQQDTQLPIEIDTSTFAGHLTIDGTVPPAGQRVGWLTFRNRALEAQYSWYRRSVTVGEDGFFRVRLPKGEYEVYFTIDRDSYPEYGSGRHLMVSRVKLDEAVVQDLAYETVAVTGPLRVGGKVVDDAIGGPEVGLVATRQSDLRAFEWGFEGGTANYVLRLPEGDYALDFVINPQAIEGVAWGSAPLGTHINVLRPASALDPK